MIDIKKKTIALNDILLRVEDGKMYQVLELDIHRGLVYFMLTSDIKNPKNRLVLTGEHKVSKVLKEYKHLK